MDEALIAAELSRAEAAAPAHSGRSRPGGGRLAKAFSRHAHPPGRLPRAGKLGDIPVGRARRKGFFRGLAQRRGYPSERQRGLHPAQRSAGHDVQPGFRARTRAHSQRFRDPLGQPQPRLHDRAQHPLALPPFAAGIDVMKRGGCSPATATPRSTNAGAIWPESFAPT